MLVKQSKLIEMPAQTNNEATQLGHWTTCKAIALFANDVTRYHEYASGSHAGASRTNDSAKWPLAIGMHCRC